MTVPDDSKPIVKINHNENASDKNEVHRLKDMMDIISMEKK